MLMSQSLSLSTVTTLRTGGKAEFLQATTSDDVQAALTEHPDAIVLGDGSNVVVTDDDLSVAAVSIATSGVSVQREQEFVSLTVAAGESWDDIVGLAVAEGWSGIEALTGIPGRVGAAPIQNIGAYGQEFASVCSSVTVFDRRTNAETSLSASECVFSYRQSLFKRVDNPYVITSVTMRLDPRGESEVRYAELAHRLGVDLGDPVDAASIAGVVRELRAVKGMILDSNDHDTWSTGSFFVNPIVDADQRIPDECPRYPATTGVKLSAAWLIENAGIAKGFGLNDRARVSTKHTLALTNRGGASTADILELAGFIAHRVQDEFGIQLAPEPVLIGCEI